MLRLLIIFLVFILCSLSVLADTEEYYVNVIETKNMELEIRPIDLPSDFGEAYNLIPKFINSTYPVSNNGLNITLGPSFNTFNFEKNIWGLQLINFEITKSQLLSRNSDSNKLVLGVMPHAWIRNATDDNTSVGYANRYFMGGLVEESAPIHIGAHELGHSFGLCDEYSESDWNLQDTPILSCPNGDHDQDGNLDSSCEGAGCKLTIPGKLSPWNNNTEDVLVYNLMGDGTTEYSWISEESYQQLIDKFYERDSFSEVAVLVSGFINLSINSVTLQNLYIVPGLYLSNQNIFPEGNYSISFVDGLGNLVSSFNFQPTGYSVFSNGSIIQTNISYFAYVLNASNITNLTVSNNNTILEQISKSENEPNVTLTSNLSSRSFDSSFIVDWDASDVDNDTLEYAILISDDNGSSFSTLEIDYPNKSLSVDTSDYPAGDEYIIKILATDGFNTGSVVSESFSIVHPPVVDLSEIYSLGKLSLFEFTVLNDKSYSLNNVSWQLDLREEYGVIVL